MLDSVWQLVHNATSHCRLVWLISSGPKQQSKVCWNQDLTKVVRPSAPLLPKSGRQMKSFGSERRYSGLPLMQVSQPLHTDLCGSSCLANNGFEWICGGKKEKSLHSFTGDTSMKVPSGFKYFK